MATKSEAKSAKQKRGSILQLLLGGSQNNCKIPDLMLLLLFQDGRIIDYFLSESTDLPSITNEIRTQNLKVKSAIMS